MKLFEARQPATLEGVSWLRKALRRHFAELRLGGDIADEIITAVVELATNVVRHGTPSAQDIGLEVMLSGVTLTFTLTDDGGAFPAFEERWRGARLAASDPEGGSGRGLAIIRAALDDVTYQSGPPNRLVGIRRLARRRPQVLVVEDEPVLLDAYLTILEPDYRVLPAQTLKQALALARKTRVDLIVSDFHLGADEGTPLIEALENDAERPPIPIVMITGDPSVRLKVLELGVDTFLTKPVMPDRLRETVKLALERSARQRARLFHYFGASLEHLVRPRLPERLGAFAAALRWETADIGGGDLVIHLPRAGADRIVLADVMGHGIQAKAGAVAHAAMVRALDAGEPLGPAAFLTRWSGLVFREEGLEGVVATALVLDLHADGTLTLASAGHPLPMVVTRAGARPLQVSGPLLGFTEAPAYDEMSFVLAPGERLLLSTDGLDPAELASGGPCPDWLAQELMSRQSAPLEAAAARAASRVAARLGPAPEDDWMFVLLQRADAGPQVREALPDMAVQAPAPAVSVPAVERIVLPSARARRAEATPPAETAPRSAADDAPDFQPAGIAALRKAVGEEAFARLALRFLENATQKIADWEEASDPAAVTAAAHALAGLLGQFGLAGAAARARAVELEADAAARLTLAHGLAPLARAEIALFRVWFGGGQP